MSSIDERIVRLKFDNQAFEQGVARSRDSLGRFTKQLETPSSGKGLDNIRSGVDRVRDSLGRFAVESAKDFSQVDAASKKVSLDGIGHGADKARDSLGRFATQSTADLGQVDVASKKISLEGIGNGIQAVSNKFKTLSVVGVAALATLASTAVTAGLQFAKSFTIQPITDGFHEYETNLNSIQTILANTQASGATLKDVEASLNDLNHYSDQTIYNFSEMAKNIGTFTAAGVDLKTSAASIKGIANLAALSGSNSEQASGAMYQLSQAISAGRVSLEDWNSVVNAGMGGTVFQRALAQTAEKMGTLDKGAVKLKGSMKNVTIGGKSFRESITAKPGQESWLTSKVLTQTLKQFTGDLSDAELKAQGFNKAEIKAIQAQAKTAKEAATQVKTFSQLVDTTKEAIGSGWSQTFQTIFGDFTEAKGLFTGISTAVNNVISKSANARNKMLSDWKALGGRDDLIKGITNGVKAFAAVIKPIHDAFREIFPATTGKQLADMTKKFSDFMSKLKIGSETADKLKRTFAGVFAVFGIGWDIVKGFLGTFAHLFGVVTSGSGGFLEITANIGDFLVKLKASLEQGGRLTKFFDGLGKVLSTPIQLLLKLTDYIGSLFEKFDSGKIEKTSAGISGITKNFGSLSSYVKQLSGIWGSVKSGIDSVKKSLDPLVKKFKDFFGAGSTDIAIPDWIKNLGSSIADGFKSLDFDTIIKIVQTGLLGGLFLTFSGFIKKITSGGEGFLDALKAPFLQLKDTIQGVGESVTNPLTQITKTLKSMQHVLQATTLLEIAAAILIMAIALGKLAKIDQDGLMRSSAAMSVMFGQLLGSMAIFQKFIGTAGFLKMPFVMGSLILLASAVNILSTALVKISGLNWNEVGKGLTGLAGVLVLLGLSVRYLGNGKSLILTGIGLHSLGLAISGLVDIVITLSGLNWSELGRGLAGLAGLLISLALFSKFQTASNIGLQSTAGILLLATGIKILTSSVKDFSGLSWNEIAKGLAGVATVLAGLALYTKFSKANAAGVAQGTGIILLAAAIKILASSVRDISSLSWNEVSKGLVGVASLLGALTLFTMFSKANTAGITQGVGIILLATGIKILASAVSDFSKISWNGLAKGLVSTAVGLALFAGALLLIPPTSVFSAVAVAILASSLGMVADALEQMGSMSWNEVAKGLVSMAVALTSISAALLLLPPSTLLSAAAIFIAASALGMIADALAKMGGMSWEAIAKSLVELTASLALIAAAMYLMEGALPGAAALLVVAAALSILAPVLVTLGSMSWEEIGKGLLTLAGALAIIGGAGALIGPVVPALLGLGAAIALIGIGVLAAGAGLLLFAMAIQKLGQVVGGFSKDVDKAGPGMVQSIGNIIGNMARAVYNNAPKIVAAILKLCISMLNQLNKYVPTLISAGARLVLAILNGVAANIGKMVTAATNVVVNFINGVSRNLPRIIDSGVRLILSFINGVTNAINAHSAELGAAGARLGVAIIRGMVNGIGGGIGEITSAAKSVASSALDAAKGVLGIHSPSREFFKIGKYVNQGFAQGLRSGDKDKVDKAFNDMKKQLLDLSKNAKATAKERKKAASAYSYLTKNLSDEHKKLDQLNDKYDSYTTKIKNAQQALVDAKKTRDDYNKSIKDEFSALPSIDADTTAASYEKDLADQIEKTKQFSNALQRLRKMGLNDTAYQDLLSKGISALPFVNDLLSQGQNGVNQINSLDKQLATVAASLGKTASSQLYDAAVHSAEGLVKGLQSQQKALKKQMDILADAMVKAIKKKLGIKSPSTVFAEVGGYSAEGVAVGLSEMSGVVAKAAGDTGQTAVDALRKSMSGFSDLISGPVDIRPVITPVLDLSSVKKDAGQLGSVLGRQPIKVDSAYSKAAAIANARAATQEVADAHVATETSSPVTFNQYNNSPTALSSAEIYRQTNNQLSRAKGALSTSANKSGR